MQTSNLFQENVKIWSQLSPGDANAVLDLQCQRISLVTNAQGKQNLKEEIEGKSEVFHFEKDPQIEAKEWFSALDLRNSSIICIFGVGLGYYYEEAKKWLEHPNHYLFFIETDLEVIHRLFETELGAELIRNRKVFVQYVSPLSIDDGLRTISLMFGERRFVFTQLAYYEKKYPELLAQIKTKIAFWTTLISATSSEYHNYGQHFYLNFFRNLFLLPTSYRGNSLFGQFKGIPAIICGAGPSLDKNLHLVEKLGDKALIFAGGTALNALNSRGFLPHFGIGIDPNESQMSRLITNKAFEIPFLYRARMYYDALKFVQGPRVYVNGTSGYKISEWFEEQFGIEGEIIGEGCNVVNFSFSLAQAFGCNPIIFVGVDMAYTNMSSYQSGVLSHPTHIRKKDFLTKDFQDELIVKSDIYGNPVYTLWKWVAETIWYAEVANRHPELTLINATEGGIGMPGVPNVPLEEVVQHYLKKQYDLRVKVHGELQNSRMPSMVTNAKLQELTKDLKESIKLSQSYCQNLIDEFERLSILIKEGKDVPENIVTTEVEQILEKLHSQIGYLYLIKDFEEYISIDQTLEMRNISLETNNEENEFKLRQAKLQKERYTFLRDTAVITISLMDLFIPQEEPLSDHENPLAPIPKEDENYSFENHILTLIDPEMNLCIQETAPSNVIVNNEYYSNGLVKLQQFYLEGALHGPLSFFNSEGRLIGRSWYVKGKQQGKSRLYYNTGYLYALLRYCDGKFEGLQEYYYRNGKQKTLCSYSKGEMHGDLLLYYPDGKKKREMHFKEGKRDGIERIWDEEGKLWIEAEYDLDRPVGIARRWHPNGKLALEIIYDSYKPQQIKHWNKDGVEQQVFQDDFFDSVTKQTGILTNSLDKVFESLGKLEIQDSRDDLTTLKQQLEHLHELNQELFVESGLSEDNIKESIWKTPESRKILETQLQEMTKKMKADVVHLQELVRKMARGTEKD